ncbi:MAG: hypothetical protein RL160_1311 [Bacteroidota bacterium]|jgi:hypothetical protein
MSLELKGKIVQVLPMQQGEGRNGPWKKQEYILEIPGQYPKKLCFNVWGGKVDEFGIRPDEELTVSFDVESREYNGRWYTEVKAWKVSRNGDAYQSAPPFQGGSSFDAPPFSSAPSEPMTPEDGSSVEGKGMPEDLPF